MNTVATAETAAAPAPTSANFTGGFFQSSKTTKAELPEKELETVRN